MAVLAFGGGVGGGLSFGGADLAVVVALEAMDKTRAGIRSAVANLDGYAKKTEQMGRKLTMALTLPLVGFGAGAVAAARSYERSFAQIEAFVGRSAAEVQAMKSVTEDLAAASGVGPRELAEGFYAVTSAGFSGSDAIKVMDAASKAAASGMGETRTVAEGLTRAVSAYARVGLTAAEATDYLAATVQQGNFRADQLANVMGRVVPVAAAVGVELDDVGAGLAVLSRQMDIDEAATGLAGIMSKLIKPAEMARDELERVGLSIEHLRRVADEDLIGALRMVEQSGADIGKVFEDIRAIRAVLALVGADAAEVDSVFRALDESGGMVDAAFSKLADTADMKISQAMARMESQLVSVGEDLLPMVADGFAEIAEMVERAVGVWNNLDAVTQKMIIAFAALVAAAGPALIAFSSLIKATAALRVAMMALSAHPVVAGLALLAAALGGASLKNSLALAEAQRELADELAEAESSIETVTADLEALASAAGEGSTEAEELLRHVELLAQVAPLLDYAAAEAAAAEHRNFLDKAFDTDWFGNLLGGDQSQASRVEAELARRGERAAMIIRQATEAAQIAQITDPKWAEYAREAFAYGETVEEVYQRWVEHSAAVEAELHEIEQASKMVGDAAVNLADDLDEVVDANRAIIDSVDDTVAVLEAEAKAMVITSVLSQRSMGIAGQRFMEVGDELGRLYDALDAADNALASIRDTTTAASASAADYSGAVADQRSALEQLTSAFGMLESAMNSALAAQSAMTFASRGPLDAQMRFLDTLDALERRLAGPVDEARRLRAELDRLTGERGQMDVDAAWRRMGPGPEFQAWMRDREERTDELRKKESKLAQEVENMTSLFDIQTKAGRENLAALLNTTDALAAYEAALIASGRSAEEAAQMLAPYRQQIIDLAADATEQFNSMSGVLHDALGEPVTVELSVEDAVSRVTELIDLYGTLPPVVATLLEAQTADALAAIDILQAAIDGVNQNSAPELTVAIAQGLAAVDQLQAKINSLSGKTVTNTVRTVRETVGEPMRGTRPSTPTKPAKPSSPTKKGSALAPTLAITSHTAPSRTGSRTCPAEPKGGSVSQPTLMVVGEAGPEVLTPLDRIPQMNGMGGGGDLHLTVNVGGSVIASTDLGETVATEVERVLSRTGNSLFS